MQAQSQALLVLLVIVAAAAPSCQAARLLKANRFANEDDPSGYSAYTAARAIDPLAPTTPLGARNGNTPEAAESLSNNRWLGVWRASAAGGNGPISYGSVEADPVSMNPGRSKEMVKTRTRSSLDTPERPVDIQNGAVQIPVLVTNGASVAQTYQGATAAAMPEAIVVNQGGKRGNRKTTIAKSMISSSTSAAPKASTIASLASTAQPVGSLALSGAANGKITLAQADSAVAMAQTEKVDRSASISRFSWQN